MALHDLLENKFTIFVIYPLINFMVQLVSATLFCNRYYQTIFWEAADSMIGIPFLTRVAGQTGLWLAFWAHSVMIGLFVTFTAEVVYKNTPYFNEQKRPHYAAGDRFRGYLNYFRDTGLMFGFDLLVNPGASKDHPMAGHSPLRDSILNPFALPGWEGNTAHSMLGTIGLFVLKVQAALILSDICYGSMHVLQHKFRNFHKYTGHSYHHNYRYPLAMCGPWLAPLDLIISGYLTFTLPVFVVAMVKRVSHISPNFTASFIVDTMLYGYIHEMNDYDHCGKQCPTWSGFPLCPPLGFALGFHMSIPNHEAHHNYSNCGFGLLGLADRCFGTLGLPEGLRSKDRDFAKRQ